MPFFCETLRNQVGTIKPAFLFWGHDMRETVRKRRPDSQRPADGGVQTGPIWTRPSRLIVFGTSPSFTDFSIFWGFFSICPFPKKSHLQGTFSFGSASLKRTFLDEAMGLAEHGFCDTRWRSHARSIGLLSFQGVRQEREKRTLSRSPPKEIKIIWEDFAAMLAFGRTFQAGGRYEDSVNNKGNHIYHTEFFFLCDHICLRDAKTTILIKLCFCGGGGWGRGEKLRENRPRTLFVLGNSMTIKFGKNIPPKIVRNFVVISGLLMSFFSLRKAKLLTTAGWCTVSFSQFQDLRGVRRSFRGAAHGSRQATQEGLPSREDKRAPFQRALCSS